MKKMLLAGAMALTAFAAQPALALEDVNGTVTFEDGSNTGTFTATHTEAGGFTDTFTFNLDMDRTATGSVITVSLGTLSDIDFDSIDINGTFFTRVTDEDNSGGDGLEVFELDFTQLFAGLQTITVRGSANGVGGIDVNGNVIGGSYAGTINLGSPIPEPATWALMLLGFGAVGYSLRHRNSYRLRQAV